MPTDPQPYQGDNSLKLLRLSGVQAKLPISRSALYKGIQDGRYPAPIKIGSSSFWLEDEIDALIESAISRGGK